MAVYNAARYFAQPVTETEVWQFFHERVFLRGVMGTTIGHVCRGVYRFGMKVTGLRYRDLKNAKAGILWYHTGRSRHYVLVRRCEDGRYAFPNSSAPEPLAFPEFYGKRLSPDMQAHQRAEPLQALPQAARPSTLTEKKYPMYWFPLSGTS